MTDADLTRIDALLTAAREVAGCSDHNCLLRVYPRGGMGTNGGCHCIGRVRTDEGLTVQAERLDLVRLLTLARQTPALVAEVRRLRAWGSVSETMAEDGNAMLGRAIGHAETFQRERDEARVEVERLRSIVEGRTTWPTDAEFDAHDDLWLVVLTDGGADVLLSGAFRRLLQLPLGVPLRPVRFWPLRDGRPCAWPVVPSP